MKGKFLECLIDWLNSLLNILRFLYKFWLNLKKSKYREMIGISQTISCPFFTILFSSSFSVFFLVAILSQKASNQMYLIWVTKKNNLSRYLSRHDSYYGLGNSTYILGERMENFNYTTLSYSQRFFLNNKN